jgi:hypothetical protein
VSLCSFRYAASLEKRVLMVVLPLFSCSFYGTSVQFAALLTLNLLRWFRFQEVLIPIPMLLLEIDGLDYGLGAHHGVRYRKYNCCYIIGAITLRACLKVVVFISLNGYKWIT